MSTDERPVIVAFDGSPESEAAVRAAAGLFAGRTLVVVSVWEPGLAMAMTSPPDGLSGLSYGTPSPETMAMIDSVQHERATETAETGAALARELGAGFILARKPTRATRTRWWSGRGASGASSRGCWARRRRGCCATRSDPWSSSARTTSAEPDPQKGAT